MSDRAERQVGERLSEYLAAYMQRLSDRVLADAEATEAERQLAAWVVLLLDQVRQLAEAERKVDAYDAARATVKREGNSRAYYVLRAEEAERQLAEAERENGRLHGQITEAENVNALLTQTERLDLVRYREALERIVTLEDSEMRGAWDIARQALAAPATEKDGSGDG